MARRGKKDDAVEQALPRDIEAEAAVLGAVMLNDAVWPDVVVRLSEEDFYREAHQHVFRAIATLKGSGSKADLVTVGSRLATDGLREAVGIAYLASLVDGIPRTTNVEHYAAVVREKARLRHLVTIGNRLLRDAYGHEESASVLEATVSALLQVGPKSGADGPTTLSAERLRYLQSLDERAPHEVIPTGYRDLDDQLSGGLRRRELVILAARPSVGKTSLMLGMAENAAAAGFPTAVFSLEMQKAELVARSIAFHGKVPLQRLRTRQLAEVEMFRLGQVASADEIPLVLEDTAGTISQVSGWIQKLRLRPEGLAAVFIDYLQLMTPQQSMDNREAEVSALSRGLKRLAKDNDVTVVALSQLKRAADSRKDKRPQLSDLRESGALEQDADVAILLFREEMHTKREDNDGLAEAIVAKQRNGPTGVVKLYFHKDYSWFSDLARQGDIGF